MRTTPFGEESRSLLEVRAQAIIDAEKRVRRAERKAFPNGQGSFDPEWREACAALRQEYRRSSVLIARGFLAMQNALKEISGQHHL